MSADDKYPVPHVLVAAMTKRFDLVDCLRGSTRIHIAAFAAGCATRVSPVFESFARADRSQYQEWIAQLWACVRSPDPARAHELRQRIASAPDLRQRLCAWS